MTVTSEEAPGFVARQGRTLLALGVLLAAFLAHVATLGGGFVYDDHRFIEVNESIRSIDVAAFFTDVTTASHGAGIQHDIYRPLRTLLFSVEYKLFGVHPAGWHAVSVILHLANALLAYLLLLSWMPRRAWAAAVGAALFAAHPVSTESVAWVSSQGDLLALTFMLVGLLVVQRGGWRRTVFGVILFALASLAKESALVWPGLMFLQDLLLRGQGRDDAPSWRTTWVRVALCALVIYFYFDLRQSVIPVMAQVPHAGGSVWGSFRGFLAALVWYAGALLVPSGFTFDVHLDVPLHVFDPDVVLGFGLLLTSALLGVWALRTRRYVLAFAALGFLACLVPVSNVIVPLKAFVAERFLYPGLVCLAAGAAALIASLSGAVRTAALGVLGVVVLGLILLSNQRADAWADDVSLWDAVRHDRPTNPNAYQGLAYAYHEEGRVKPASRAVETYLGFNPIDGKAWLLQGDNFKAAADSFYLEDQPGVTTDIVAHRHLARRSQISAYREALRLWDTFGDRARLSATLVQGMLLNWIHAAEDLGDVGSQKRANDRLIGMAGIDADNVEAVRAGAPWRLQYSRLGFAHQAIAFDLEGRRARPEAYAQAMRDRAAVLRDVGLDPSRRNEVLRPQLAAAIVQLFGEGARSGARMSPGLYERTARQLLRTGAPQAALEVLAIGVRHHPEDAHLGDIEAAARRNLKTGRTKPGGR